MMGGSESKESTPTVRVSPGPWLQFDHRLMSQQLNQGDLLEFDRGMYKHWAVYEETTTEGESLVHWVIHFSGEPNDKQNATIRRDKLSEVAGDSRFRVNNECDNENPPFSPQEIVERARGKLNKSGYSVITDNCEHFAKWTRSDRYVSTQKGLSFWDFLRNGPPHPLISGKTWSDQRHKHPDERENWFENLSEIEKQMVLDNMIYPDGYN